MRTATLTVYYDYTCGYSYRAMQWLDLLPDVRVEWRTFSLKEVNRAPEEPSWVDAGSPPSVSVLALALAHAARDASFDRYHRNVFEAMHGEHRTLGEDDLAAMASEAGVDVEAFESGRATWVGRVGDEHRDAVSRLGAYGTPTLVFDGASAYVRLREVPRSNGSAAALLEGLRSVAGPGVDLIEVFPPPGS